jgi:hypothetical protein
MIFLLKYDIKIIYITLSGFLFRLCFLVVRVPDYRSRGPGSIPGATRFSESSVSGMGSTHLREYN